MKTFPVIIEVSARHYHPQRDIGYKSKRPLSQQGYSVAHEHVDAYGLSFAVILPPREKEVYELSMTDWITHIKTPPQFSGTFQVKLRHFHCDKETARLWSISHGQHLSLEVGGIRGGRLDHVEVRIDEWSVPRVHIDTDEANALYIKNGDVGTLVVA